MTIRSHFGTVLHRGGSCSARPVQPLRGPLVGSAQPTPAQKPASTSLAMSASSSDAIFGWVTPSKLKAATAAGFVVQPLPAGYPCTPGPVVAIMHGGIPRTPGPVGAITHGGIDAAPMMPPSLVMGSYVGDALNLDVEDVDEDVDEDATMTPEVEEEFEEDLVHFPGSRQYAQITGSGGGKGSGKGCGKSKAGKAGKGKDKGCGKSKAGKAGKAKVKGGGGRG